MQKRKHPFVFRFFAILLIICLILSPINVTATEVDSISTRASNYLSSYNTYLYPAAFGKIQIYFHVTGVNYMDEIGTLTIKVYESTDKQNWTWVKSYTNGDTPSMLGYDNYYYSSHVDYQGIIGRYYKAYVCIWAGKDGSGDTRYMWTDIQKASLLPG